MHVRISPVSYSIFFPLMSVSITVKQKIINWKISLVATYVKKTRKTQFVTQNLSCNFTCDIENP
jgi:hypothetical protein